MSDDLISRAGVINWYCEWECGSKYCGIPCREVEEMQGLPSAEPQRERGEWIDTGSGQECSVCHEIQYGYDNFRHYCPNCGAKMGE